MKLNKYYTFPLLVLALLISSCSDDSTSSDTIPPEYPEIAGVEPDVSYFENGPSFGSGTAANENFIQANLQTSGTASLFSISQIYGNFFNLANNEEANLNDGVWSWTYSYSYEGQSVEVLMTSEERAGRIYWQMDWSWTDGTQTYEDYTIIEGSTNIDGTDGEWTVNTLEPDSDVEVPILISEWEIISETEEMASLELLDNGTFEVSLEYNVNGSVYTMSFISVEEPEILIGWNTDSGTGYYQEGDAASRVCWDSNYENIACS